MGQDACTGCGLCTGTAPNVFRMNLDATAEAYANITDANKPDVDAAIDGCPDSAIRDEE